MSDTSTRTSVRRAGEDVAIIDLGGEITSGSEQELMEAFNDAAGSATKAIVLNFGALEYMNSGGIGLLVTILIRANRSGQHLVACGLSDHYRQIFSLTRLDEAIACYDDEASAVAAAAGL